MATVRKVIHIEAPPESVWAAVRDLGAVHQRLAPGLVTSTNLEDGIRVVTFENGLVVRERIITIDDTDRRLAYAALGGRATHHNASIEIHDEGAEGTSLVWTTDVLPDELAASIAQLMDAGSAVMQSTLADQNNR